MRDFFKENKRLLIWLVILAMILLTIKGAAAIDVPNGGITYYNFSSVVDLWGSNDATNIGATSTTNYPSFNIEGNSSPNSYYFAGDASNNRVQIPPITLPATTGEQSISLWIYVNNNDADGTMFMGESCSAIQDYFRIYDSGTSININGVAIWTPLSQTINTSEWTNLVFTRDGTNYKLYINGVYESTKTLNTELIINFLGCGFNDAARYSLYGSIDEFKYFNKTLNVTEINNIYNYGYIQGISNFTITAIDAWNSSTILSFNVTINGTQYNTTTGVIQTTIPYDASSLFDILFTADGYNDRTYEDYNVSTNLEAELYPFNSLEVYAINLSSGSNVTNFTTLLYNEDGSYQNITTSSLARFSDLDAGTYTARISSDGFNNAFYTLTVSDDSYQTLIAYLNEEVNEVIFQSQDEFTGNNVEGVTVSQFAFVNSSLTLIQAKYSDISGRVSFFHDGSSQYKFRFEKDGYTTREFFLAPEFDSYIVKITPSSPVTNETLIDDVVITVENYLFYNNLTNWFNFTIVSPSGALSSYSVNITTPNNSSLTSGSNAYGELVSASVFEDTAVFGDAAKVTICYLSSFYSEEVCRSYVYPYKSWLTSAGGLQGIIDSTSGMGRLEKALVATFFILVFAGFMAALGSAIGAGGVMAAIGVIGGMGFFWQIEFINKYVFFMIALIGVMYVLSRTGAD